MGLGEPVTMRAYGRNGDAQPYRLHKGNLPDGDRPLPWIVGARSDLNPDLFRSIHLGMGMCRRGTRAGLSHIPLHQTRGLRLRWRCAVMTRARGKVLSAGPPWEKAGLYPRGGFCNSCMAVSNLGSPFRYPGSSPVDADRGELYPVQRHEILRVK